MMESMMDIENKGQMANNQNVMAGSNLLNFGGEVAGAKGTYFANGNVVASLDAKFGSDVKIYTSPSMTAVATTETAMK